MSCFIPNPYCAISSGQKDMMQPQQWYMMPQQWYMMPPQGSMMQPRGSMMEPPHMMPRRVQPGTMLPPQIMPRQVQPGTMPPPMCTCSSSYVSPSAGTRIKSKKQKENIKQHRTKISHQENPALVLPTAPMETPPETKTDTPQETQKYDHALCVFCGPQALDTDEYCEQIQEQIPNSKLVSWENTYKLKDQSDKAIADMNDLSRDMEFKKRQIEEEDGTRTIQFRPQLKSNMKATYTRAKSSEIRKYILQELLNKQVMFTRHIDAKNLMELIKMIQKQNGKGNSTKKSKIILFCPQSQDPKCMDNLFCQGDIELFQTQYFDWLKEKHPNTFQEEQHEIMLENYAKEKISNWVNEKTNRALFVQDMNMLEKKTDTSTMSVRDILTAICEKCDVELIEYNSSKPFDAEEMATRIRHYL